MPALVVPGVRVEARFDVLPPLPAPSGIVGIAGIVDRRRAAGGLVGVTKTAELRQLLGPGTALSLVEAGHALGNGAAEIVVSPVAGGSRASATLLNGAAEAVVLLRARANGAAGNDLRAEIRVVTNAANEVVRATLRLLRSGRVLESFSDLQIAPGHAGRSVRGDQRQFRAGGRGRPRFRGYRCRGRAPTRSQAMPRYACPSRCRAHATCCRCARRPMSIPPTCRCRLWASTTAP